jgi:hypothetical protein
MSLLKDQWQIQTFGRLVVMDSKGTGHELFYFTARLTSDLLDNLVSETPLLKQSSLPTRRASTPDSPVDEQISRRMKKRKSVVVAWSGLFK